MGVLWTGEVRKKLTPAMAKTGADLVTHKQLVAIRVIANSQGLNAEAECLKVNGCIPEELGRRAASAFISYLKAYKPEPVELGKVG